MRYGPQYGPDITFLGVDRCDWSDAASYSDADVVILGAPFDGGTSYRSGTRFGPQYIRQAWWTVTFPGIALCLLTLGIALLSDGLNDALNPRLNKDGR